MPIPLQSLFTTNFYAHSPQFLPYPLNIGGGTCTVGHSLLHAYSDNAYFRMDTLTPLLKENCGDTRIFANDGFAILTGL